MRQELLALMQRTGDPFAEAFAHRGDPAVAAAATRKVSKEYRRRPAAPRGRASGRPRAGK